MVVVGAILIQLALGAIYAWSVFTPSLVLEGWAKSDTQWVFAIGLASFALFMVFAGKKLAVWGPQKLALIGGVILGLGYFFAGLIGGTNFWALLLLIGLVGGAGIGFAYVVPIAVGMRWFPDKKGMITGLAVAGFGFGALLWVKLAGAWGHLIENVGLSNTFMAYGIAFAVMVIIGGMGSLLGCFLGAAFILVLPIILRGIPHMLGIDILAATTEHITNIVIGVLIIFFLIVEPHGLARLWQIGKEKLRTWPFPYASS